MSRGIASATLILAILLLGATRAVSADTAPPYVGQRLGDALESLRSAGLRIVYSDALVEPSFVVKVEPAGGAPHEIAERILAPYGLKLVPLEGGRYAVARDPDARIMHEEPSSERGAARVAGPLDEVAVYASRYRLEQQEPTVSLVDVSRDDLDALPGLLQDAMRAMRYLPGNATNPVSARTHVRGGRQDEVAVYFDGVPLYEPFHFKDLQGLLGMLDPGVVSTMHVLGGVFPVRFGNRLSGVLDIEPRRWTGTNEHELGASLLYSHALTHGEHGTLPVQWLGAVRRGNVDLISDLLEWDEAKPVFLDALLRIEARIGEHSSVAAGWMRLDDRLRAGNAGEEEHGRIDSRDSTAWLKWRWQPDAGTQLDAVVSRTERHTTRRGFVARPGSSAGSLDDQRRFDTTTALARASMAIAPGLTLHGGLEAYDYDARYDYRSSVRFDPLLSAALGRPSAIDRDLGISVDGQAWAAHAGMLLEFGERAAIDFGLRWDAQRYGTRLDADQYSPRIAARYSLDDATTVRASWGRMAQAQRPDELQVQDGEAAFHPAQRGVQTVLALERRIADGVGLRIEAYEKRISSPRPDYENLFDPLALFPELEVDRVRIAPDRSRARGIETSLRWDGRDAWSGWITYGWSRAIDVTDGRSRPRSWDQRHALGAGAVWSRYPWTVSGSLGWHTGWPRTELLAVDASPESWPAYVALDLRVAWTHRLPRGSLELFLDVDNAMNRENLCCTAYRQVDGRIEQESSAWLPRYALVGVTWRLP